MIRAGTAKLRLVCVTPWVKIGNTTGRVASPAPTLPIRRQSPIVTRTGEYINPSGCMGALHDHNQAATRCFGGPDFNVPLELRPLYSKLTQIQVLHTVTAVSHHNAPTADTDLGRSNTGRLH